MSDNGEVTRDLGSAVEQSGMSSREHTEFQNIVFYSNMRLEAWGDYVVDHLLADNQELSLASDSEYTQMRLSQFFSWEEGDA